MPGIFQSGPVFIGLTAFLLLVSPRARAQDLTGAPTTTLRLPDGMRFCVVGERPPRPAPTIFVFSSSLETDLANPIYMKTARIMASHGFICVLLDPPAHGEDHRSNEPVELEGWRARLDHGEDFIGEFTRRASAVLDHLVKERYTDPQRVAACGTSRGAFLAFHFAAAEPRIRFIGGIAALTNLMTLKEFRGTDHRAQAEALSLTALAPRLVGRPARVGIGNNDTRVDTDEVIAFTRALVRATAAKQTEPASIPVELVINTTVAHRSTIRDHEFLTAWLLQQFDASP